MPRVYDASFDVALPVERAWSVMSDTQHLNQVFFGLGALEIVSRDTERARIRGTFGVFAPEYDEYPWVFDAPHQYRSVRVFTRGLLKRLETTCTLREQGGGTHVDYHLVLDVQPGPLGAVAGLVFMARLERGLAEARRFLENVGAGPGAPVWPPANPMREAVMLRAEPLAARIASLDDDEQRAVTQLVAYIADQPEPDVARMRPYELASGWQLPRQKVLTAFLKAAHGGLLRLSWDLLCPACESPTAVSSLHDLPQGGHCPACDIDFGTNFDENVEATFAPEPAVRAARRLVFCHGSPSSTKSWLAQFVIEPGQHHDLVLTLGPGRYRLQAAGIDASTDIDVHEESELGSIDEVSIAIEPSRAGIPQLPRRIPPLRAGRVCVGVDNRDTRARRVQLAHRAFASAAATAADVTALGLFKDLFGQDALAPDQHLAVGRRSIVFTDLVGSTAMYERIGDAAAYGLVRAHFKLLFAVVEQHDGRVVKTVGDCVMASFDTPVHAARAARAMVLALRTLRDRHGQPTGLKLRVGVHTGPCLAVEANGQTDYFGRTVNVAARVEGLAAADECVLSWTVVGDPEVRAFLDEARAAGDTIRDDKRAVKGVAGEVEIVRVAVADSSGTLLEQPVAPTLEPVPPAGTP